MRAPLSWPWQRKQPSDRLTRQEKDEVELLLAEEEPIAEIAERLGRAPSTIWRYAKEREHRQEEADRKARERDPIGHLMREVNKTAYLRISESPEAMAALVDGAKKGLLQRLGVEPEHAPPDVSGWWALANRALPYVGTGLGQVIGAGIQRLDPNALATMQGLLAASAQGQPQRQPQDQADASRMLADEQQQRRLVLTEEPSGNGHNNGHTPTPAEQPAAQEGSPEPTLVDWIVRWVQLAPEDAAAEARVYLAAADDEPLPFIDKKPAELFAELMELPPGEVIKHPAFRMIVPGKVAQWLETAAGLTWLAAFRAALKREPEAEPEAERETDPPSQTEGALDGAAEGASAELSESSAM